MENLTFLLYFALDLAKNIIVNKHPEGQRDRIADVWWIRDDVSEGGEVEFLAEDDDSVFTVENCYEEEGKADRELHSVIDPVFKEEALDNVTFVRRLNVDVELVDLSLNLHVFRVVLLHRCSVELWPQLASLLLQVPDLLWILRNESQDLKELKENKASALSTKVS